MEISVEAALERIEKHIGPTWTKVLCILVAIAVGCACVKVIVEDALVPLCEQGSKAYEVGRDYTKDIHVTFSPSFSGAFDFVSLFGSILGVIAALASIYGIVFADKSILTRGRELDQVLKFQANYLSKDKEFKRALIAFIKEKKLRPSTIS